jgi:hypothetical protein
VSVRLLEFVDLLLRVGELAPEFAHRRRRWSGPACPRLVGIVVTSGLDPELAVLASQGVDRSA